VGNGGACCAGAYSGDGGAATNAELNNPIAVALDDLGDVFIADLYNGRVRKVDTNGIITTVATSPSVPWSEIGPQKAVADYKGDGLAVTPTKSGARLRCVFQRLDANATGEGLWLTSTVSNGQSGRFPRTGDGGRT